jgi:outer membrane biogenesis lipoprotein LolB
MSVSFGEGGSAARVKPEMQKMTASKAMTKAFNLILALFFSTFLILMGCAYSRPPVRKTTNFQQRETQLIECIQYTVQCSLIGQSALQHRCG